MLEFVLPEERNREDVLDFYREFEESGGSCIGFGNRDNYDLWLQGMRNRKAATDLPEGFVRENFYLCYDGEEQVLVRRYWIELIMGANIASNDFTG